MVSLRRKLLFSCCIVLGPFVLAEVALRIAGFGASGFAAPPPVRFHRVDLSADHVEDYLHADPELFWTLRPGANLWRSAGKAFERVNDHGLRGWSLAQPKPDGVRRVAVIGDSCAYGFSVELGATLASRLERLLRGVGVEAEIVNGSVPGYSSTQFVRRFRRDMIPYEPDVLLVYAGQWNDFTPATGLPDHEVPTGEATGLAQETARFGGIRVLQAGSAFVAHLRRARQQAHIDRVERIFREEGRVATGPRVPMEQFRANLVTLVEEARAIGAHVYLLPGPVPSSTEAKFEDVKRYRDVVREVSEELDAPYIDAIDALRARDEDAMFYDWVHPSSHGHGVLARLVFERFCEDAILGLEAGDAEAAGAVGILHRSFDGAEWDADLEAAQWTPSDGERAETRRELAMSVPGRATFRASGGHRRCTLQSRFRWTGAGAVRYTVRVAIGSEPPTIVASGSVGDESSRPRFVAYIENRDASHVRVELAVEPVDDEAATGGRFVWSELEWLELP